jgi:hypothetical protein
MDSEVMTAPQICVLANRSYQTLQFWIRDGKFPPPLPQHSGQGRLRLWRAADVREALKEMGR